MDFENIIGHSEVLRALDGLVASARIGHAYLFLGPSGIGKKTIAQAFAGRILCEEQPKKVDCQCSACRLFENDAHPDFKVINPNGNSIKIEQLRELQHLAYLSPVLGKWKIFFFPEADKLTEAAGNSFLKLLEEAPPGVIFLFAAIRAEFILPTIRSRCQVYNLFPVSTTELQEALLKLGYSEAETKQRVLASQGIPGQALAALNEIDPTRVDFKFILQADLLQLLKLANEYDKKERQEVLELLAGWQAQARNELLTLSRQEHQGPQDKIKIKLFVNILEKLVQVMNMVQANVNCRLALEEFFISCSLAAGR